MDICLSKLSLQQAILNSKYHDLNMFTDEWHLMPSSGTCAKEREKFDFRRKKVQEFLSRTRTNFVAIKKLDSLFTLLKCL